MLNILFLFFVFIWLISFICINLTYIIAIKESNIIDAYKDEDSILFICVSILPIVNTIIWIYLLFSHKNY